MVGYREGRAADGRVVVDDGGGFCDRQTEGVERGRSSQLGEINAMANPLTRRKLSRR